MANEFIIKNGLKVQQGGIQSAGGIGVTGSLAATGGFTGSLSGNASTATTASFASTAPFSGVTGKPTLVSGSAQINLSQATGTAANATSASFLALNAQYGEEFTIVSNAPNQLTFYRPSGNTATAAFDVSLASTASYVNTLRQNVNIIGILTVSGSNNSYVYIKAATEPTLQLNTTDSNFETAIFNSYGNIGIKSVQNDPALTNKATDTYPLYYYAGATNANNAYTNLQVNGTTVAQLKKTGIRLGTLSTDVHSFTGSLSLNTLNNATTDTDRFIVSDGGTLKYRTGAEVLSDIGGQASGNYVTDAGGAAGQVGVWSSATAMSGSDGLYWSGSNLGVNVINPQAKLHVSGAADVLLVQGSGSAANTTIFAVDGNNGRLFEISDDLSDSLFSVNTIAGLPVIEAFADNTVTLGAYNQYDIHVTGSKVGFGKSNPAYKVDVNGTVAATALVETSARKFKTNIKPLTGALEAVTQLQGVSFVRIGEETQEHGFIADDVHNILPELVSYDENGAPYGVHYARTVAIQNEAIKELNNKVNSQELFIRDLLRRIEKLENK